LPRGSLDIIRKKPADDVSYSQILFNSLIIMMSPTICISSWNSFPAGI
jgi:hypothetical protein